MTATLTLEAAEAMSKVIDQIHIEDGHPELAIPFEDLPADEKVRRLRMVTAVGDVYLCEPIEALKAARQFIVNGVALGYIRMPDADCPDKAHKTLPAIEAALSRAAQGQAK